VSILNSRDNFNAVLLFKSTKMKLSEKEKEKLLSDIITQHQEMLNYIAKYGFDKFANKIYDIALFVEYSSYWLEPLDEMLELEMFNEIHKAFIYAYT
jgi:predicted transposase